MAWERPSCFAFPPPSPPGAHTCGEGVGLHVSVAFFCVSGGRCTGVVEVGMGPVRHCVLRGGVEPCVQAGDVGDHSVLMWGRERRFMCTRRAGGTTSC